MFHDYLFKAQKILGSRKEMAKATGVSIKIVNNWFTRDRHIALEHALMIEIKIHEKIAQKIAQKRAKGEMLEEWMVIIRAESLSPYAAKQIKKFRDFCKHPDSQHFHEIKRK